MSIGTQPVLSRDAERLRPPSQVTAAPAQASPPATAGARPASAAPASSGDRYTPARPSRHAAPATRDLELVASSFPAPSFSPVHPLWWEHEAARLRVSAEELKSDKFFVLQVVRDCGEALRHASEALRSDRQVVQAAVRSTGTAIGHAAGPLKADKVLVLEAVKDDSRAYTELAPPISDDPDVLLETLRLSAPGESAFHLALGRVRATRSGDAAFHLRLLRRNAWAIDHVPAALLQDPAFAAEAARTFPPLLDREPLVRQKERIFAGHPDVRRRHDEVRSGLERLGIEDPMRLRSAELLDEVLQNRLDPGKTDKPMAVVVFCKSDTDHNGAMRRHNIDELSRNYRVMYYEARTDRDLIEAVRDAGRSEQASLVVIAGHGEKRTIDLGDADASGLEEFMLDHGDEAKLRAAKLEQLVRPDATVMLMSCSTGEGRGEAENIANLLARLLPGREVFAPVNPTSDQLKFDQEGRFVDPSYSRGEEETYRVRMLR
jgi:hypothetical protein